MRNSGECCAKTSSCTTESGLPTSAVAAQYRETTGGRVTVVGTELSLSDRIGGWKVRWGIGRDRYSIPAGLYSVGEPGRQSPVLVTANYKLSFDTLRRELGGLDAWILVLDTRGINVWCAAGKGTFGTDELVRRIEELRLREVVEHRTVILPQLGAPGVAAHEVKRRSGFRVVYGPVRASEVVRFLRSGMKAAPGARRVSFTLRERMAVVPVELVAALKYGAILSLFVILGRAIVGEFTRGEVVAAAAKYLGSVLAGSLAVPLLLPWIPFRSFALKGWLLGLLWALTVSGMEGKGAAVWAGNALLLPAISSFLALNFTGSTTFTSQTGVNREIRLFARPIAASGIMGALLLVGHAVM